MSFVFISYSHTDRDFAHRLVDSLEARGIEAWIDDRIDYGSRWPRVIQEHLDQCAAFVLVMSPRSYESEWVRNELAYAMSKRKPIFPLLLEGDIWLVVATIQVVPVTSGALPREDFYTRLQGTVAPLLRPHRMASAIPAILAGRS